MLDAAATPVAAALVEPHHFYLPRYQIIFAAILSAAETKKATDPIVVGEVLKSQEVVS